MFDRRLPSVVPMDYRYLAGSDGSEQAYGRGAGVQTMEDDPVLLGGKARRKPQKTPYMHMTFHPLERRLDTVVWRALFASSARQARQFVVRGAVRVNGKKMIYPGYLLNPGDMFTVEPDLVMYATGQLKVKKDLAESRAERVERQSRRREARAARSKSAGQEPSDEAEESEAGAATLESDEEREAMLNSPESQDDPKKALRHLMIRAKRITEDQKRQLSAKRLQELRDFGKIVRTTLSKLRGIEEDKVDDTVEGLESNLREILLKIPQDEAGGASNTSAMAAAEAADAATNASAVTSSNPQMRDGTRHDAHRARLDATTLHAALEKARENPIDSSKPYATPWKPREYMSAFAFIPRYLEVNQNVCGAVYLRHPVARPGIAEAPTPFSAETLGLSFNWYLRRR